MVLANTSLEVLTPKAYFKVTQRFVAGKRPMNAPSPSASLTVTDAAYRRIAKILADTPDKNALRISVEGGGCSGFSYKYDLVNEAPADDDQVFSRDGGKLYIDEMSLVYMGGSEVDFVDNLMGQAFEIRNPNAVASCGCGTSFSV